MHKTLTTFLKVIGKLSIGILSLIGVGTLLYLLVHSSTETPVGIAVPALPSTANAPQIAPLTSAGTAIQFGIPIGVWGTRFVVIPVGIPNQKQTSELKSRAGMKEDNTLVNVAVVNEQTDQTNLVFNRPLAIGQIDVPRDSSQRGRNFILYTAYASDSDSNGVINSSDNAILFSSALDGTGTRQITPDSLSVLDYHYRDHDARLRITLAKRPANGIAKPEDWEHVMLWYALSSNLLSSNKDLDAAITRVKAMIGK